MARPRCSNALTIAAMLAGIVPTAVAQVRGPATREAGSLNVPAGPLDDSLKALARQSGIQLLYPARLVAPHHSRTVSNARNATDALATML
jgi:iron complex outermembrane receptor protein